MTVRTHVVGPEFVLERTFRAPPAALYAAWTDPAQLVRWWGPATMTNHEVAMDARPGGRFRIVVRGEPGDYPLFGEVLEAVPPERLVLVMHLDEHPADFHAEFARLAGRAPTPAVAIHTTVTFDAVPEGTRLRVVQRFETTAEARANAELGAEHGWGQSLDRLDTVLATTAPPPDTLAISRVVNAPRERVWRAFGSAESLDAWWGPDAFVTRTSAFAFEVGGEWRFTMTHPEHGTFPNRIRWSVLLAPERMRFWHDDGEGNGFESEIWLEALPGGATRVTLRQTHPSPEARARVQAFGAEPLGLQTLGKLARFVGDIGSR